jgi:hypothetical protein
MSPARRLYFWRRVRGVLLGLRLIDLRMGIGSFFSDGEPGVFFLGTDGEPGVGMQRLWLRG